MISPRFAPAVCILAGLALIPTLIHSYAGVRVDDGRSTAAIPATLAGFTSTPSGRNASWGRRRFDSDDWTERRYHAGAADVTLTVVRSDDLKALYHHPELAVAYREDLPHYTTRRFAANPDIPVHVLQSDPAGRAVALYVLRYGNRYVEHPIRFQMRTALELLLSGRQPMTLFFAQQERVREGADPETLPLAAVLFAAIEHFDSGTAR